MANKAIIQKESGPIAKQITLSALRALSKNKRFDHKPEIINADLIPKFHERVVEKHLKNKTEEKTKIIEKKSSIIKPVSSIKIENRNMPPQISPLRQQPRPIQPVSPPIIPQKLGEYGKIDNLIKDPTLTLIECPGINKNLYVLQMGRRQITNIILTKEEILQILKRISEKTKIPLIPGNFRAITDNFFISAIISDAEVQFIIKKQSPYTLLK